MKITNNQIKIFFSWQADSPSKTNRYFIEDCLKKAAKEITKEVPIIFKIDRDTKDVGGMPGIVDTIFKKIRDCDIFVWDATIVCNSPKHSPNPNVLIELGYAFALLGDGRIIGIINESNGIGADKLPFDLIHRRWPISYKLGLEDLKNLDIKNKQKKILVDKLKEALKKALNEPKKGVIQSDIDFLTANKLWRIINSSWLMNWLNYRKAHIQYEEAKYFSVLEKYLSLSSLPEYQFVNENLQSSHKSFLESIENYLSTSAKEMVPSDRKPDVYIISIKTCNWFEDYDKIYERQVNRLLTALNQIEDRWKNYVQNLRILYPEITHNY